MLKSSCEMYIEQFRLYFPDLYDRGIDWWKSGPYHVTFLLNNRERVEFDASENTIRWIHKIDHSVDNTELRKMIGRNIRKYMTYKGLTQEEVSDKVGITQAMLSRYINGTSMPGYDKLYNLARVLNCHIDDFTDFDNDD